MKKVVELLLECNKTISTMESCTGGALANSITNICNASKVFKYGAVTYSNEFKIKMGVNKNTIDNFSVYSIEVAEEMAKVISSYTDSDFGVGITGKLNKEDEANPTGANNKVFVSIYEKDSNNYFNKQILVEKATREYNKKKILDEIEKMLLEIIND